MYSNAAQMLTARVPLSNPSLTEISLDKLSSTVYLAAPVSTYGTARYLSAVEIIVSRHPRDTILLPHDLWTDSHDWLRTFQEVLEPVSILYILCDRHGFVGKGVFTEVQFLRAKHGPIQLSQAFAFTRGLSISACWDLQLRYGGMDWCRYASLRVRRKSANRALKSTASASSHAHGDQGRE